MMPPYTSLYNTEIKIDRANRRLPDATGDPGVARILKISDRRKINVNQEISPFWINQQHRLQSNN